jgi:hypothetical protein
LTISHPDYEGVRLPLGSTGRGAWVLDITVMRRALIVGEVQPDSVGS